MRADTPRIRVLVALQPQVSDGGGLQRALGGIDDSLEGRAARVVMTVAKVRRAMK